MAEALREKIEWKSAFSKDRGQLGPKFQVQGVVSTKYFSCEKTKWMGLLNGIRISAEFSFVLSQIHAFDRRTDISLMAKTVLQMQSGKKVKKVTAAVQDNMTYKF